MKVAGFARSFFRNFGLGVALFSTVLNLVEPPSLAAQTSPAATTPIQHVIIIIGENRSFDHVYATYKPKHGEKVSNLLSRGIVNADGTPGPNYLLSAQYSAVDTSMFDLAAQGKAIYGNIPPPLAGGATKASDTIRRRSRPCGLPNSQNPTCFTPTTNFSSPERPVWIMVWWTPESPMSTTWDRASSSSLLG